MSLLEVRGIESGYGKLPVLHDVSLDVDEGEIVAIAGPNGAGKTTLMRTIFQLLPATRGSVTFDGHDLTKLDATKLAALGLGYVPQGANTFPDLSVEDNLKVALARASRREAAAATERVYERFPVMLARRRQRAKTLSGGERQILALASAIIEEPRFLALDEPTTGLAPTIVQILVEQILELRRSGMTVLWVIEESPLQILGHVDRVYILQAGAIERELPAAELLHDEALQAVFFGAAPAEQIDPELARRAEDAVRSGLDAD